MANLLAFGKRLVNQVNPFDDGRTYQQSAPTARGVGFSPLRRTSQYIRAGVGRSLTGTAEGFSGLYDLATPGTGTNRITKSLIRTGAGIDKYAQDKQLNPLGYRGWQAIAEAASFLTPSATLKAAGNTGKVGRFISSAEPLIGTRGFKYLSKPATHLNALVGATRATGFQAAREQDINERSVAQAYLTNLAFGKALDTLGNRVAGPVVNKIRGIGNGGPITQLKTRIDTETSVLRDLKAAEMRAKGKDRTTLSKATLKQQSKVNELKYTLKELGQSGSTPVNGPLIPTGRLFKDTPDPTGLYARTPKEAAQLIRKTNIEPSKGLSYADARNNAMYAASQAPELKQPKAVPTKGGVTEALDYGSLKNKFIFKKLGESGGATPESPLLGGVGKLFKDEGKATGRNIKQEAPQPPKAVQNLSGSSKPSVPLNTKNYKLNPEQKAVLNETIKKVSPDLEKVKGSRLSNKEVIEAAKTSDLLTKVSTREQTKQAAAALLRTRQNVATLDKHITDLIKTGDTKKIQPAMRDFIDNLRVVKGASSERGRLLQSLKTEAGEVSGRADVLAKIAKVEGDTDKILKAAEGVDWDNAESVTKFYRSFVKPSIGDILKEYRYNNMLSSPKTQARNAFSNIMQTFAVKPTTIALQGHPLKAFQYEKGAVKSLPDAFKAFGDSWSGKTSIEKPDLKYVTTGKLPKIATVPTRAMEASDQFFQALIRGGEQARGLGAKQAQAAAEYTVFRQKLHPEGQGKLLNKIDDAIGAVDHIRDKVPGLGWAVPFIRTPMNFAKQWVEYSPVTGPLTMIGAKNKREQLAKTIIGSVVTAYGANLAMEGRTTWAVPTDPKEKELFYASGKKPYSVKIGGKWVPMIYSGPMTLALGLPAAAKYYQDESKTALTDSQVEKLARTVAGTGQLWTQQTFVQGIGSFVNMVSGDADFNLSRNIAGFGRQVVPATGLLNYITSIVDPIYRKPAGLVDNLKSGIPGLSDDLKPYTLPTGEPSTRVPINKFLPYDVGQPNAEYEGALRARTQKLQGNAVVSKLNQTGQDTGAKTLPDGRVVVKIGDEFKPFDSQADAQRAVARDTFDKSGKSFQEVGDTVFRRNASGEVYDTPKVKYDYQVGSAKLVSQKSAGDIGGWMDTANKQLQSIQKQLKDPSTDPLDQLTLQNQAQSLLNQMAKYKEYGGFTKGKKAKRPSLASFKISSIKAPKISGIKVAKGKAFKAPKTKKLATSKMPKITG